MRVCVVRNYVWLAWLAYVVASVAHTLPVARCEIEITYLIAEDLYLTVAAMEDRRIARILERIDLYMQRQALCERERENICSMVYGMCMCICIVII